MKKVLAFRKDAREKLFKGVEMLNDAVTTTLGPKGRNVAIERTWGVPIIVHDGVTVSREVAHDDPLINMGINLVKMSAQKTNEEAGDGTTTATLLAYEIVKRGMEYLSLDVNPMVLRDEIYAALPVILEALAKLSKPVKNREQIARIAFISAANEEIGRLVAEALDKVGKDGMVTVEEGKGLNTEVEYTEGMEFHRGYLSPYFITSEQRMEAVVVNPVIAVVNKKLSLINEIVPLLEAMAKVSKDIVVIGTDISGDALATLAANKMKGNINSLAVAVPPAQKEDYLDDIAVLTGARVISDSANIDVAHDSSWMGRADKVVADRDSTVIINGKGDKKAVEARIAALRSQIKAEKSEFRQEQLEERLAKLSTGVAVVKVGAKTELDMREKVERVKDAVGAAEAAREEGVVAGGGVTFLRLAKTLTRDTMGSKLLYDVFHAPTLKLLANAGESVKKAESIVVQLESGADNVGYEVNSGRIIDLVEAGIIDPAKVIRLCIENAVAVGTSILTTDALIGIVPEKKEER